LPLPDFFLNLLVQTADVKQAWGHAFKMPLDEVGENILFNQFTAF